jgi:membrane protease YdiL (CAAX protease family)
MLAYSWGWLVFVPLTLLHGPIEWTMLATFGPTVAALITQRISRGNYCAFRLGPSWPRTGLALLVGVLLILLAYVVLPAVATANPRKLNWSILASLSVYNYSSFLAGPLGEEPGWRGYALQRLEASVGTNRRIARTSRVVGRVAYTFVLLTQAGQPRHFGPFS